MIAMILRALAAGVDLPNVPCADGSCASDGGNVVGNLLGWAYFAIGAVAALIIIVAGIQYITSQGEPEKTKRAQATITYTVIGLVVAMAATTIIGFVTGAFS